MMTALFTCDRFQDFFCRGKTIPLQTDCQEELLSSQSRPGKSKQNVDEEGSKMRIVFSLVCLVSDPHRWCYLLWRPWLPPWLGDWRQRRRAGQSRALATFLQSFKCQMWISSHREFQCLTLAFTCDIPNRVKALAFWDNTISPERSKCCYIMKNVEIHPGKHVTVGSRGLFT